MPPKRRRDDDQPGDSVVRPDVGTRTFVSGAAVKEGLASGSRQAFVSFHQQIHTYQSKLPLPISHPTVTILQHYLDVSPSCDEILNAWREGDRTRNDRMVESAVGLLGLIVRILKPLPFFRTTLVNLANKVLTPSEPFSDAINRSLQSERRDLIQATLSFVAAVVQLDPPTIGVNQGSGGKLSIRLWSVLSDGGSIRGMGKMFGMRIRNQEGKPLYDGHDPNDRADIRHLALQTVLPLLALPNVYSYARTLMPPIYSHMDQDPPVTIFRILSAIWDVITLSSPGTSRRISLALINESSLEYLFKLLPRADFDPTSGQKVGDIVKGFIEGVTTTPGRGLCFADDGWYPRQVEDKGANDDDVRGNREDKEKQKLHNRILSNVIRKLGARAIDNDGKLGEIVTKIVKACPELVAGYWAHSALAVDPKLDIRWMATMAFIGRIIALPPPSRTTFRRPAPRGSNVVMPLRPEPPAVSTIIESILPSPMHKNHLTRGLQHPDALVRHMTAVTLARGLQKLQVVQNLLGEIEAEMANEPSSSQEGSWSRIRRELEFEARRRVPDVIVVLTFAQQSAQLAPVEAETEEEQALMAKSTMLTESALRLFGLYYRTLPSLAGEAKFDVGRLLVSSSSAKAEKKQRNMIKSGSVADGDSGSIASFGTAGTAGMGGGFGYARGEVRGFDALSQVHVLALLRDVKEWDWARKAAASQFTYLYHILQLNLNTQLSVTRNLSSSLINNMLQPTLLFEHDPAETYIWMTALPRAHSSVSGPLLTVQQIHLLSFLDDCFRRAQQFPYRYMEQLTTLLPDYFSWSNPSRMVSCVLMAILEQFHAKVQGQLIATDAAVVVLGYLRRVMLGLMGKMDDPNFVSAVLAKLEETCEAAKVKGQERPGLQTIIRAMRHDTALVFGGSDTDFSETTDFPRLVDEEQWRATSLESLLLHGADPDLGVKTQNVVGTSPAAVAARQARFLIHLLSQHPPTSPIIIDRIQDCLIRCRGSEEYAGVKTTVFEAPCLKELLLTDKGDHYRDSLASLVSHLSSDSVHDFALIEPIVARLVHLLKKPKKYNPVKTLEMLSPWSGLLDAENATTVTGLLAKAASKLKDLPIRLQTTISEVFKATRDSKIPLEHFSTFMDLDLYRPFIDILSSPDIFEHVADIRLDATAVKALLDDTNDEARTLVAGLVKVSPDVAKSVAAIVAADPERLGSASMLPIAAELLDLPKPFELGDAQQRLLVTSLEALRKGSAVYQAAARRVLSLISDHSALTRLVTEIDLRSFTSPHAKLAVELAKQNNTELSPSVVHLVQLALQQIARACSGEGELAGDALDIISHILSIIELLPELAVAVELVEPVITTVISDRLNVDAAVNLATKLAGLVTLKASFVRQHLQAMLSAPTLAELSETTSTPEARLPFVQLYSALFVASTYVSCQPNFVEPLVPLYRGTLSTADQVVLDMFQTFESVRRVSMASVLRSWSASGLTGTERAFDAFTSLDGGKVNNTCALFPLHRKIGAGQHKKQESNEKIYDPVFIMALLGATLHEKELTGLEWVEIMRCGGLGIVVCALSARDKSIREFANWLLSKTFSIISGTSFHERDQLLYTLRLIRHAIPLPAQSNSFPRIPPIISLFLSYVIRAQATPSHFLYPITSRFLLQRPILDTADVPALYSMLYASEDGWKNERAWIVRLLRDGMKSETDWRVAKRRHTWSLLATLFQSSLDIPFRRLILQVLAAFVRVPMAVRSLVTRDCVLVWLETQFQQSFNTPNKAADEERATMLRIYETIVCELVRSERQRDLTPNTTDEANPEDTSAEKEPAKSLPGWILDIDIFIQRASFEADPERLECLSRILKSVSTIQVPVEAFLAVYGRLETIKDDNLAAKVAENLFEAALYLSADAADFEFRLDDLQKAVSTLKRRVASSESDQGRWVRRETRNQVFEQHAQ